MKTRQKRATSLAGLAVLMISALAAPPTRAATVLESIMVSPDTTTTFGNLIVPDQGILVDDLGGMRLVISLGPLPDDVAVDAFHDLGDGAALFSVDAWVELDGLATAPGDVMMWDGAGYSRVFDAATAGLPPGVDIDAVTLIEGQLAMSFDVAVDLPGGPFNDSDLVIWDGSAYWLVFSATSAGVASEIGLDAVHRLDNGHLLLSFDTGGSVSGVTFADEDILEHDPAMATWELVFDGSMSHPSWVAADLEALSVGERRGIVEVPTLSTISLLILALFLALAGTQVLRRRGFVPIS